MPALRHHPKHLEIFVLTQTDGTGGFLIIQVLRPRELGVRVYDALVETNDGGVIVVALVVVLSDKDNTGEHNAVGGSRIGI